MRRQQIFVVKLSGSLFFSGEFYSLVATLKSILRRKKSIRIVLVAGGGKTARNYINAARQLGVDEASLDELGIGASRLNARTLILALSESAYRRVPTTLSEIVDAVDNQVSGRLVVTGGLHPGQSTNAVAALIAEKLRAERLMNATDVKGVYTKDPRKFRDAKFLKKVGVKDLSKILESGSMQAGGYDLMDQIALKIIQRSSIPTTILECKANVLSDVLLGKKKHGTEIVISDSP